MTGGFDLFSYSSSFYYSKYQNYIMGVIDVNLTRKFNPSQDPIHPKVIRNIDDAYKTGFESMVNFDFLKHYFFKTEVAYVHTKNQDFNESLPLSPPFTTKVSAGFNKEKY